MVMWMYTSANGYSMNPLQPRFEALVVDGGKIVALGDRSEIMLQYGARVDKILDLGGATVLPGLVDSHLHVSLVGEQAVRLDLSGVTSKAEMLHLIRAKAGTLDKNEWVLGGGFDDNKLAGGLTPTLAELDEAANGRPLLLTRICQHAQLANTKAFQLAGIGPQVADPVDGRFGRDEAGGLNGWVYENAAKPLLQAVPRRTRQEQKRLLRLGMEAALRQGITAVHTDDTRVLRGFVPTWDAYYGLIHEQHVSLRVHQLVDFSYLEERLEALADLPPLPGWLETGAVKLFSDGAFGGRTAWLAKPYSDAPGWFGTPIFAQDELNERVQQVHHHGLPVAIHAIGDAALDATLTALEGASRIPGRDRIVHAELIRPDLLARMGRLGGSLAVDVQPRFTVSDFPWIRERLGPQRTPFVNALAQMKRAGLHLAGGSDAPIEPLSPLFGMHAAVTRRRPYPSLDSGRHDDAGYEVQESLSMAEAIRLFTQDACYADGTEEVKGVLAPGWNADLTILDSDVLASEDTDDLLRAKVLYTIVGGKLAYAEDGLKE